MTKISSEIMREASKLLTAAAAEQLKLNEQHQRFEELVARGLELVATGEVDGHWFGSFVESCEEVLGERESALTFGRLLGYHTKSVV